ncbi:AMP-binding protein [Sphingomonas sp. S2-65]|uniref:AMP-binding protein n=1 Tax=Sphingomonas sp. S2-65 TaxID=2903960 RepID=UPI001F1721FC|nr:AMP-binding protein [Sphingomonas sp. S2-65]UYY57072.1 AMP-binding protein [Sphingomonas sp. S2-65]
MDRIAVSGVLLRSSLSFIEHVFSLQAAGRIAALVPNRATAERLDGVILDSFVEPAQDWGWFEGRSPDLSTTGPAQISFTSGTTGRPSGILLDGTAIHDTTLRIIAVMHLDASVREYVGVPCTHSFGLGRFRAVASVGGRAYLPEHGFDPAEFAEMLERGQVNALSAVPSLLRILIEQPHVIGAAGAKLRWLEIGSQPLALEEKHALKRMFPECRIVQHYGLTEASRTTFLDLSLAAGKELGSVGRPTGRAEVTLDVEGRVRIRGPHTARYRIDESGCHALLDGDGWLTTSDLGHVDDEYLYFEGRFDDVINCGGIKLSPDLIQERMSGELGTAQGYAVARTPDAMRGDGILVALEVGAGLDPETVRLAALKVVAAMGVRADSALHLTLLEMLPRTASGKVQRVELSRIQPPAFHEAPKAAFEDVPMTPLCAAVARELGRDHVSSSDSVTSLQVDSLNYIQLSLLLDQLAGPLPDDWETRALGTLERRGSTIARNTVSIETSTLIRGIAILLVVLDHTWRYATYGAAVPLMVVAGANFARFQVPLALDGRLREIVGPLAWRVILPYFAIVTVDLVYHGVPSLLPYVFLSNLGGGVINADGNRLMVSYWFIENYILFVAVFGAALSWRPVRNFAREHEWELSLGLLAAFIMLGLIGVYHRDSAAFDQWTLLSVGWAFVLGWSLQRASNPGRKMAVVATLCLVPFLTNDDLLLIGSIVEPPLHNQGWPVARVIIFYLTEMLPIAWMVFVTRIEIAAPAAKLISKIASVSLYIYIIHPFVLHVTGTDAALPRALFGVFASTVAGVTLAKAIDWSTARVARSRLIGAS